MELNRVAARGTDMAAARAGVARTAARRIDWRASMTRERIAAEKGGAMEPAASRL